MMKIDLTQQLPSGLVVELAPWTADQLAAMLKATDRRKLMLMDSLLSSVCVVEDPFAMYGFGETVEPRKLLVGDRLALTILQRLATFPSDEGSCRFSFVCDSCSTPNGWVFDLRRLLLPALPSDFEGEVYGVEAVDHEGQAAVLYAPLGEKPILLGDGEDEDRLFWWAWGEEEQQRFASGDPHTFTATHQDLIIEYQSMREGVAQDIRLSMLPKKPNAKKAKLDLDKLMFSQAMKVITKVTRDGEEVPNVNRRQVLGAMHLEDFQRFNEEREEVDPGLDLNLEVVCSHCGHHQEIMVPLEDPAFFSQTSRTKRSSRRSRRST